MRLNRGRVVDRRLRIDYFGHVQKKNMKNEKERREAKALVQTIAWLPLDSRPSAGRPSAIALVPNLSSSARAPRSLDSKKNAQSISTLSLVIEPAHH